MAEVTYVGKIKRVVALMRATGTYTAVQVGVTTIYTITSNVKINLAVKDYVVFDDGSVVTKGRIVEIVDWRTFRVDFLTYIAPPAIGRWTAMAPYFDFGTKKTINAKLLERGANEWKYQKYPLVALRFPSTINTVGGLSTTDINILIANFTKKTYKPQERFDTVFIPILYPLLYKFLEMVRKSGEFSSFETDYQQIDRMFYGTEQGETANIANEFDDPLDAVEVRNLKLNFVADQCSSLLPLSAPDPIGEEGGFEYAFESIFES